MNTPDSVLSSVFQYSGFRGDQRAIIDGALAGRHSLVLMPTGMGKSVCYQVPAKLLPGLTLVISPLIALMKDQVDAAKRRGFRCAFINSSLNRQEREKRYAQLARQEFELLYVTPERFQKAEFREALARGKVSLLAIDEAHCISEWGHDFRPDYTRIREFREFLGWPTTMALTATATLEVRDDILRQGGLAPGEVTIFDHGIRRENLSFAVADLVGLEKKVAAFVSFRASHPGPTILYFSLISSLEKFSQAIGRQKILHDVYHGQLRDGDRRRAQERFMKSADGLILATPAFGLGVDKPDIRAVVHAELTGSVESYYQEVGRAGRDGRPASSLLLYDSDDISIQMDFIKWANPDPGFIRTVFRLIERNPSRVQAQGADFLREQMNFYNRRDFRVESAVAILQRWDSLEGSLERRNLRATSEPEGDFLDAELWERRLKGQQQKLLAIVQYAQSETCRQQKLYAYFGTSSESCGHCDNCGVTGSSPIET